MAAEVERQTTAGVAEKKTVTVVESTVLVVWIAELARRTARRDLRSALSWLK